MKKTVNPENVTKIAFSDEILQVNVGNSQEVQKAIAKVAAHPKGEKIGVKLNDAFTSLLDIPAFKSVFEPHIDEAYAHNGATC